MKLPLSFPTVSRDVWVAVAAAALLSFESWAFGPLSWIYGYGSGLETIPSIKALTFEGRNFSLWAPFVAGGVDRLSFWGNANPLGPEYFLFSTFPVWLANGLHRFFQYFVAVYFAARVAKEQLSLDGRWGSLTGVMYGCFSYMTVGALFTYSCVPVMLWLMWRFVTGTHRYLKASGSGFLLSFATTFTFGVPYLLTFAVLWLAMVQRPNWRNALGPLSAFSLALIAGTLPQLLAIAVNAPESHRTTWIPESIIGTVDGLFYRQLQFDMFAQNPITYLITMNLPRLAFLVGFPLAWMGFRRGGFDKVIALRFFCIFAIFTLISQKWAWLLLQDIGSNISQSVRGIYMGRFFQIPAPFLIAVGLTLMLRLAWYFRPAQPLLALATGALATALLVVPKAHLFYPLGVDDWGQANYTVPAVAELIAKPGAFRVASVLPLQPAYAYAQGLETADGWANLYPKVYREYWLRILSPLFSNVPGSKNIFDPDSGNPQDHYIFLGADLKHPTMGALPGEDPTKALQQGFDVERRFNLNMLGALNVKYLLSAYPLSGQELKLVHAPAQPPTVLVSRDWATGLQSPPSGPSIGKLTTKIRNAWADWFAASDRKLAGKDIFIYELTNSLDRFRFVNSLLVERDGKSVLDKLSSMSMAELRSTAVVEVKDSAPISKLGDFEHGRIDVISYKPDRIELAASITGNGYLVIANTWSPYWRCGVDGRPQALVRTNHTHSGLPLEAGSHKIVLTYHPPYAY